MVLREVGISDGENTGCDESSHICLGALVPLLIVIVYSVHRFGAVFSHRPELETHSWIL